MKITINISARHFEKTNYILATAITTLMERPDIAKRMNLTAKDVVQVEKIRLKLVDAFFKELKND